MSGAERCDEVLRLIEEALADYEMHSAAPATGRPTFHQPGRS